MEDEEDEVIEVEAPEGQSQIQPQIETAAPPMFQAPPPTELPASNNPPVSSTTPLMDNPPIPPKKASANRFRNNPNAIFAELVARNELAAQNPHLNSCDLNSYAMSSTSVRN